MSETKFVVAYKPGFTGESGGVCTSSYFRGSLRETLKSHFKLRPNEELIGLVIDKDCITGYFETHSDPPQKKKR